jgi:DNA-binding response OmpR family regulator
LIVLITDPTRVFTREQLLSSIWGVNTGRTRTLDSHAFRLRRKLRQAGAGEVILNVWGIGYAFQRPNDNQTAAPRAA